jgi:hypothetical protein
MYFRRSLLYAGNFSKVCCVGNTLRNGHRAQGSLSFTENRACRSQTAPRFSKKNSVDIIINGPLCSYATFIAMTQCAHAMHEGMWMLSFVTKCHDGFQSPMASASFSTDGVALVGMQSLYAFFERRLNWMCSVTLEAILSTA